MRSSNSASDWILFNEDCSEPSSVLSSSGAAEVFRIRNPTAVAAAAPATRREADLVVRDDAALFLFGLGFSLFRLIGGGGVLAITFTGLLTGLAFGRGRWVCRCLAACRAPLRRATRCSSRRGLIPGLIRLVVGRAGTEGETLRLVGWTRAKGVAGDFALAMLAVCFAGDELFLCVVMIPQLATMLIWSFNLSASDMILLPPGED